MTRQGCGIDVGTHGVRALRGRVDGTRFVVTGFAREANPDGSATSGWAALDPSFALSGCRVGLTGRDVNLRYSRVPRVADWQLRKLMRFEAAEVAEQSDAPVASDFNVLAEIPEIQGEDIVLLALAREELLDEHGRAMRAKGARLDAFTPNAVALYNAFLRYGVVLDDTVLVANVGATSTDIVLVRGSDLLYARNVGGGAELFDEALAERFQVGADRARRYKESEATLRPGPFRDANQEKAYKALSAPAGTLANLLQSSVLFAKSQIKVASLKLDRVLLCGGGSRLEGLPEALGKTLEVPVERFDPFVVCDTERLAPDEAQALDDQRAEAVIALGLATLASDPEAYSVEILPEAVRRRRYVTQRGSFLVAAAVLALVFLAGYAWRERARGAELRQQATLLETRLRSAQRHDDETRALLDANEALSEDVAELHALAASGETLARTLVALERHLPDGFWLEGLSSAHDHDEGLGISQQAERPVLRLRGRAREGTEAPTELFAALAGGLRSELPGVAIEERMGDTAAFFTLDLSAYGSTPSGTREGDVDTESAREGGAR